MGMPDPMMVIGFGVVLLLTVLVFVFISNRSAQPTRVQAARSTPLDMPDVAALADRVRKRG